MFSRSTYHEPARWSGYVVAAVAAVAALLLHLPFQPVFAGKLSFLLFVLAVMVSGWYGGLEAGLVCMALSIVAWVVFYGPGGSFHLRRPGDYMRRDLAQMALFLPVSVGISLLCESLHRGHRRLRQAGEAKDRFLAMLSHELRTPLTPALLALSAYEDRPELPAEVRDGLHIAHTSVQLQARLVDDLLDVNRIAKGKLHLHLGPVDAAACLRHAAEICRPESEAKQQRLSLETCEPAIYVSGDAVRLEQVFWNLLRNAIKFTPERGTITARSWHELGAGCGTIVVEVADTGIGIDPESQSRIFAPFEQASATTAQQYGGLGLGLTICRSLVELQHGSIAVASKGRGRGSTFVVRLPAISPPAQGERQEPAVATLHPGNRLHILLVEDNPQTLRLLAHLLRQEGHEVLTATGVSEALTAADSTHIDLLISDLGLPDGSGHDLMRQLHGRGIKGLALSGHGTEDDVAQSKAAGFAMHLTKPVDLDCLIDAIHGVAGGSLSARQ